MLPKSSQMGLPLQSWFAVIMTQCAPMYCKGRVPQTNRLIYIYERNVSRCFQMLWSGWLLNTCRFLYGLLCTRPGAAPFVDTMTCMPLATYYRFLVLSCPWGYLFVTYPYTERYLFLKAIDTRRTISVISISLTCHILRGITSC